MFTGLVQALGTVRSVEHSGGGVRLLIDASGWAHRPSAGDSMAVSGCCLTVAAPPGRENLLAFDAVAETLARTTLGGLTAGSRVNLEHSATASTLLGGHVVQGHVEGVGVVVNVHTGSDCRLTVRPPPELMECMVPKGSVCLDGVSLTLAAVDPKRSLIEVALIPTTIANTTLGGAAAGTRCNIETDVLSRTVVHWLRNYGSR